MAMEWYRAYHGMQHDPKLKVIAKRTGQSLANVVTVWVCLLDAASQHDPRGIVEVDAEELAAIQDMEIQDVEAIIKAFYTKNMLDENNRLTAWDKRQRTTATERSQKSRAKGERKETASNTMQRDATPRSSRKRKNTKDMTDTDTDFRTDADSESDTKKDSDIKLRTREEKKEPEKEKQQTLQDKIAEQMLQIWNSEVQQKITKTHKAILTPQRKDLLCKRWKEDFHQDVRAWRYYCEIIGNSDFCLGKIEGKSWTIDLSWAIESSEHIAKVLEGGFSGGNHPPKAPQCDVPALQLAWDAVLLLFQQKHGKPTCRSWLANTVITRMQRHCDGAVVTLLCPSKFSKEWLTTHYMADLNRWFAEATQDDARVTGVELITEA